MTGREILKRICEGLAVNEQCGMNSLFMVQFNSCDVNMNKNEASTRFEHMAMSLLVGSDRV